MVSSAVKSSALLALSCSLLVGTGIGTAVLASHSDSSLSHHEFSSASDVSEFDPYQVIVEYMESSRPATPTFVEVVSSGWVMPLSLEESVEQGYPHRFKGYLSPAHVFNDYYSESCEGNTDFEGSGWGGFASRKSHLQEYLSNLVYVYFIKHPDNGVGYQLYKFDSEFSGKWVAVDTVYDSADIVELINNYHTAPEFGCSPSMPYHNDPSSSSYSSFDDSALGRFITF